MPGSHNGKSGGGGPGQIAFCGGKDIFCNYTMVYSAVIIIIIQCLLPVVIYYMHLQNQHFNNPGQRIFQVRSTYRSTCEPSRREMWGLGMRMHMCMFYSFFL